MASPSKVALHWQLLPYESLMSKKKIFFNVAKDLECIRVDSPLYGRHLSNSDFDKVASPGDRLTSMKIQYPPHPQWTIKVQNSNGITCRDVYKAIHDHFQKKLSISDQKVYVSKDKRPTYEEALNARCRADPGLDDWIRKQGMKRVDMLEEGTYFHGLTRPADDKKHWVLNLCESSALTRSR